MQDFTFKHASLGAIWGIALPCVVSLLFSLIASIVGNGLGDNAIFITCANACTELGFLAIFIYFVHRDRVDVRAQIYNTKSPKIFYLISIILSILSILLFQPLIDLWGNLLNLINFETTDSLPFELSSVGYLFLALFLVGLLPAVCEELLFRGVVLNGLRKFGAKISVGFSALFFSLMHLNLQQLPYTFILGIICGLIVYYTRNIWLSIILHFVNNATVILVMYFFGTKPVDFVWWQIPLALVCVLGACGLMYLVIRFIKKKTNQDTQEVKPQPIENKRMLYAPLILGFIMLIFFSLIKFGVI